MTRQWGATGVGRHHAPRLSAERREQITQILGSRPLREPDEFFAAIGRAIGDFDMMQELWRDTPRAGPLRSDLRSAIRTAEKLEKQLRSLIGDSPQAAAGSGRSERADGRVRRVRLAAGSELKARNRAALARLLLAEDVGEDVETLRGHARALKTALQCLLDKASQYPRAGGSPPKGHRDSLTQAVHDALRDHLDESENLTETRSGLFGQVLASVLEEAEGREFTSLERRIRAALRGARLSRPR